MDSLHFRCKLDGQTNPAEQKQANFKSKVKRVVFNYIFLKKSNFLKKLIKFQNFLKNSKIFNVYVTENVKSWLTSTFPKM